MKNLKEIKTTLFGLAILVFTGIKFNSFDFTTWFGIGLFGGLIALSIAFLFMPDAFLSVFRITLKRKSKEL